MRSKFLAAGAIALLALSAGHAAAQTPEFTRAPRFATFAWRLSFPRKFSSKP